VRQPQGSHATALHRAMDSGASPAHTGWMDTRRRSLTRRSALTALTGSALVALTALAGTSAVAAPRTSAPAAPAVTTSLSDVRLPSAPTPHRVATRAGGCDVSMMSDL